MNEFNKQSAITQASTIGAGALAGLLSGGIQSLSRTDDGARLLGGAIGGSTGGAAASLLPAAFLKGNFLKHYVNTKGTLGNMFNVLNLLMAVGGSTVGSKIGENAASVVKNSITGGKKMLKNASAGSNGLIRMFSKAMGRPMGREARQYLKPDAPINPQGLKGINRAIKGAKSLRGGTRGLVDHQLKNAQDFMKQVTGGPHYNFPGSPVQKLFGGLDMHTPAELLEFVKKLRG